VKLFLLFAAAICLSCSYSTEEEVAAFVDPASNLRVIVTRTPPFLGRSADMSISAGGELHAIHGDPGFSGTACRTNLYRLGPITFLIRGILWNFTVDVTTKRLTDYSKDKSGEFIGSFDEDASGKWRFIPASERRELAISK
jgi:hypothetical protein